MLAHKLVSVRGKVTLVSQLFCTQHSIAYRRTLRAMHSRTPMRMSIHNVHHIWR